MLPKAVQNSAVSGPQVICLEKVETQLAVDDGHMTDPRKVAPPPRITRVLLRGIRLLRTQ